MFELVKEQTMSQKILVSKKMKMLSLAGYLETLANKTGEDFSSLEAIANSMFSFMNGERHFQFRRLIAAPMSSKSMEGYHPIFRSIADETINRLKKASCPDLIADFADPIYVLSVEKILGLKVDDEVGFLEDVDTAATLVEPLLPLRQLKIVQNTLVRLYKWVSNQESSFAEGSVAAQVYSKYQGVISHQEMIVLLLTLVIAARTTSETIANIIIENSKLSPDKVALMTSPEWVEKNVDTLIRYCASTEYLTRVASEDQCICGRSIKKGEQLFIHVPSANRDPSYFDDTEYKNILSSAPCKHMSFGSGAHRCPGAEMSKVTIKTILPLLYQEIPTLSCCTDAIHYKKTTFALRISSVPAII